MPEIKITLASARQRFPKHVNEALTKLHESKSMYRHARAELFIWKIVWHDDVSAHSLGKTHATLALHPPGSNMHYHSSHIIPVPHEVTRQ